MDQVEATLRNQHAKDPAATWKRIADAYAKVGVSASEIESFLGHPLAQANEAEVTELRAIHAAIVDGATTWKEASNATQVDAQTEPKPTSAQALKAELKRDKAKG